MSRTTIHFTAILHSRANATKLIPGTATIAGNETPPHSSCDTADKPRGLIKKCIHFTN